MGPTLREVAPRDNCRLIQAKPVQKRHSEKNVMRLVSTDTAILVKAGFEHLGEFSQQVSQQVTGYSATAPDRWFTGAMFKAYGVPIAVFSLHPNAGRMLNTNPDHPVTREYAQSMRALDALLTLYRTLGFRRIVGGDLNMTDKATDPAWSPYRVFARHGMVGYGPGFDKVFWEPEYFAPVKRQTIPKATLRTDHPGVRVTLRVK